MIDFARFDLMGWLGHYGTVLVRVSGILFFVPILGAELLPPRIRMFLAGMLAFVLMPYVPPLAAPPQDVARLAVVAARELAAGVGLGIAARTIFAGVEGAAGIVAGQSGFALASMIDPTSGDQGLAPALFQNLLSMALFLAADLHHLFIRAIVASYELLPPAAALPDFGGLDRITSLVGLRLFAVAVELAAPALVVTLAVDLVMAVVGRAMPQAPILLVGYPFKMAAGLVAMAILVTSTGAAVGWIGRTVAADGAAVIAAFAGKK